MANVFSPMNVVMAFGAGLASAVLFASVKSGTLLAVPLFLATGLPLIIAALGWGTPTGIAATLVAAVVGALAFSGPEAAGAAAEAGFSRPLSHAGAYLIGFGLPSLLVAHLVGLARQGEDRVEWYPLGRVVMAAALATAASAIVSAVINGIDAELMERHVRAMVKAVLAEQPSGAAAAAQFEALVQFAVRLIALAYPVVWTAVLVATLWIGAKVVSMSGRLARPWEDLAAFELPRGTGRAFLAAVLAQGLGGTVGLVASVIAGALAAVLAMLGLAVLHTVTRGSGARPILLATVYGLVFLFSLLPAALLVVLGLAERFLRLRDRRRGGAPDAT